ncbi:putative CRISPR-associated protein [Infirmifilum uzonense]|uniref:putative CRISPR-associated protein n=1 Tax=Infirmifilum uzonense TaxID=1550241 RepID=UPI00069C1749|nr:putative CRISPR-associated protein [Infirmifilum uzonense]
MMQGSAATGHIVAVGTSLIRNLAQKGKELGIPDNILREFSEWTRAAPRSPTDAIAGGRAAVGTEEFETALRALGGQPFELSAELNAMRPYLERGIVRALTLLASDTGVSEFQARVLASYLEAEGVEVEVQRVQDLGIDFQKGLFNLLDSIVKKFVEYREKGLVVYINLTGGFKLESAILYLAACLTLGQGKAYYIHETMRDTVEVPIIPVMPDPQLLRLLDLLSRGGGSLDTLQSQLTRDSIRKLLESGVLVQTGGELKVRDWIKLLINKEYQRK